MEFKGHETVMKNELVECLIGNETGGSDLVFFDLTLGGGGHSFELLKRSPLAKVVAIDQDEDALANALAFFKEKGLLDRIKLVRSNFSNFPLILKESKNFIGESKIAGVMADIGVSSHQFDEGKRGFSFRFDGPLDMRMNYTSNLETASDVINEYDKESLVEIFKKYGEEKLADRIAENICDRRAKQKITTTKELENIVFHSYPKKWRYGRTHPATKVFQALRIFVNKELEVLESMIPQAISALSTGGRLGIITFHSLEDRIVKHSFRDFDKNEQVKLLQRKPLIPSDDEISMNPRSRSAKLRVVTKL